MAATWLRSCALRTRRPPSAEGISSFYLLDRRSSPCAVRPDQTGAVTSIGWVGATLVRPNPCSRIPGRSLCCQGRDMRPEWTHVSRPVVHPFLVQHATPVMECCVAQLQDSRSRSRRTWSVCKPDHGCGELKHGAGSNGGVLRPRANSAESSTSTVGPRCGGANRPVTESPWPAQVGSDRPLGGEDFSLTVSQ